MVSELLQKTRREKSTMYHSTSLCLRVLSRLMLMRSMGMCRVATFSTSPSMSRLIRCQPTVHGLGSTIATDKNWRSGVSRVDVLDDGCSYGFQSVVLYLTNGYFKMIRKIYGLVLLDSSTLWSLLTPNARCCSGAKPTLMMNQSYV